MALNQFSAGVVFCGPPERVLKGKEKLEALLKSEGLRVVFVKSGPKRLFIIEDSYDGPNGGGRG